MLCQWDGVFRKDFTCLAFAPADLEKEAARPALTTPSCNPGEGPLEALELSCLPFPWCPPHSASGGHHSEEVLGSHIIGSLRWVRELAAQWPRLTAHKTQCRLRHGQNRAGDVFVSPFHLDPFSLPLPMAPGKGA